MKMRVSLIMVVFLSAFYAGTAWGCTEGYWNNFFGNYAGVNTTSGNWNTFLGGSAGQMNTTGSYNTFVGMSAGTSNDTGSDNTFIGHAAGLKNTGWFLQYFHRVFFRAAK